MAIIDLPGAFLHTDLENDDQMLMVMEDRLSELMAMTEPKIYWRFVTNDNNGKKVLYVKLQKAFSGLLKSVLLQKVIEGFVINGFPNPYDPCVINKEIDGSQMTITWHVDDLQVLHKDPRRIVEVAEKLKQIHGNSKIKREKMHNYLGMCLD